jgi:3-hydroxymyristoyl/3-hydroxydecanoyl-(acyl carrier protein) dehydratase
MTDLPTSADIDLIQRVIPHRYPFLLLDVTVIRGRVGGKVWKFKGVAHVDGEIAAEAEFAAMIVPPTE